ncbi:hypothetical protein [Streptomyces sp. NPDC091217]|uniref:hypothetical protein n=1 Tax=Streptomyces sp. NPDC091217 TaxID=3365975 RepID=UPI00382E3FF9
MLATVVHLRDEEHLSLWEIASWLVIRTGEKRGRHPSPGTVMRMLRGYDGRLLRPRQNPRADLRLSPWRCFSGENYRDPVSSETRSRAGRAALPAEGVQGEERVRLHPAVAMAASFGTIEAPRIGPVL